MVFRKQKAPLSRKASYLSNICTQRERRESTARADYRFLVHARLFESANCRTFRTSIYSCSTQLERWQSGPFFLILLFLRLNLPQFDLRLHGDFSTRDKLFNICFQIAVGLIPCS
jgi:hypothetical protein